MERGLEPEDLPSGGARSRTVRRGRGRPEIADDLHELRR